MQIEPAVCAFCGCLCDDIALTIEGDRIVQAKNACALGKAWFTAHSRPPDLPAARVDGQAVELEEAIEAAATLLAKARYPILYGLSSTSCEAQRHAVALAEALGGCIDCCTSVCHGPSGMAAQGFGEPTCTLGEVKNRADLVIYWGSNPAESYPRHMSRYAVTPKGRLTPNGRRDRTVVLVDVRPTPSSRAADLLLTVRPGMDFEILWALRALVLRRRVEPAGLAETGVSLAQLAHLVELMKNCRYGVLFAGQGLTQSAGNHLNLSAAILLARDLNQFTKFAIIPMRGHGNVTGVDQVLTWQTGYPFGVNFSRGYPRFNPGEFTMVDVLRRKEADAVLSVASDPAASLPAEAAQRLTEIPLIAIDAHESETTRIARVSFMASTVGIRASGTAYRMDNVPLFLKQVLPSIYPSDEEILGRLLERVRELKA